MRTAAVIGLGAIAPIHLAAIKANEHIRLVAVCDVDEGARSRAPEGVPAYADFREMIEQERPDCVHVCLPHYLHYPVSKAAVEMGVNVFCEKPVALNDRQAQEFVELEASHPEVHIGICLQNRLNETTEELKRIIEGGEYGRVVGIRGTVPWFRSKEYYEESPWRGRWAEAGSGVLMNQSIHTLDLMYYLGGPVARLRASVAKLLDYDIEVEDTVSAQLEFENGARGLFFSTNANFKNEGVELSVDLEGARFHMRDNVLYQLDEGGREHLLIEDAKMPGSKFYYGASHDKLIGKFYASLEDGSDDYIHVRDAYMSLHLIDIIKHAGLTGAWAEV